MGDGNELALKGQTTVFINVNNAEESADGEINLA